MRFQINRQAANSHHTVASLCATKPSNLRHRCLQKAAFSQCHGEGERQTSRGDVSVTGAVGCNCHLYLQLHPGRMMGGKLLAANKHPVDRGAGAGRGPSCRGGLPCPLLVLTPKPILDSSSAQALPPWGPNALPCPPSPAATPASSLGVLELRLPKKAGSEQPKRLRATTLQSPAFTSLERGTTWTFGCVVVSPD